MKATDLGCRRNSRLRIVMAPILDGSLLDGVRFRGDLAETESIVMRSQTGTVRRIKTTFRDIGARFGS